MNLKIIRVPIYFLALAFFFWKFLEAARSLPETQLLTMAFAQPLFPSFFVEAIWVFIQRRSLRRASFVKLLTFTPSHEGDLFFWMFFQSMLIPIAIVIFPVQLIDPILSQFSLGTWSLHAGAAAIVAFLVISLTDFIVHLLCHRIPFLWELHKVHHSLDEMTVLSSYREHLLIDMLKKIVVLLFLGLLGLSMTSIGIALGFRQLLIHLQHSEIDSTFGWLGEIIVSPHAHRIHHLCEPEYFEKNFGFDITLWDRIAGTFLPRAEMNSRVAKPSMGNPDTESDLNQGGVIYLMGTSIWRALKTLR